MNYLYIHIEDSYLLLALLNKSGSTYTLLESKSIPLSEYDFFEGKLYNPAALTSHLTEFAQTFTLKNIRTIICLPHLGKKTESLETTILQTLLSFCKTGVRIDKVISHPLIKKENLMKEHTISSKALAAKIDYFELFFPETTQLRSWLAGSVIMLFLVFGSTTIIQRKHLERLAVLAQENAQAHEVHEDLKDKLHAYHITNNNNNELSNVLESHQTNQKNNMLPPNLLRRITLTMQETTWLSRIKIGPDKQLLKSTRAIHKQKVVTITANTLNSSEIAPFLQSLSQIPQLHNISLESIQRRTPQTFPLAEIEPQEWYSYKLAGEIKKNPSLLAK